MSYHDFYMNKKINMDKLSSTKHLRVKDSQQDHIKNEQMQSQLIKNIQKNQQLHYDNPNYRTINPINYKNQPEQPTQKPHMKLLEQSTIDHIKGTHSEAPLKKQLKQGEFNHLSDQSHGSDWKSSSKRIDFQPS